MKIINVMIDQVTYDRLESLSDPDCLSFDKTVTQAINSLYESQQEASKLVEQLNELENEEG